MPKRAQNGHFTIILHVTRLTNRLWQAGRITGSPRSVLSMTVGHLESQVRRLKPDDNVNLVAADEIQRITARLPRA
jgi:hypothetical protein